MWSSLTSTSCLFQLSTSGLVVSLQTHQIFISLYFCIRDILKYHWKFASQLGGNMAHEGCVLGPERFSLKKNKTENEQNYSLKTQSRRVPSGFKVMTKRCLSLHLQRDFQSVITFHQKVQPPTVKWQRPWSRYCTFNCHFLSAPHTITDWLLEVWNSSRVFCTNVSNTSLMTDATEGGFGPHMLGGKEHKQSER